MNLRLFILLLLVIPSTSFARTNKYRCIWRDNPATTMTIAWNQVSGTSPTVYYDVIDYGQDIRYYNYSKSPDKKVSVKGLNNHFARLTGLQPDTDYYFVIVDSQGASERYWFRTAPNHPNKRISIIAGGDSRNNRPARQNANKLVAKLKPLCVVFNGDMTGRETEAQWDAWYDDWQYTIDETGRMFPIIPARGNHEYANKSLVDQFDAPNRGIYYGLNIGGSLLRIYTLNSMIASSGDQKAWLENDLASNKNKTWKIAQYHHSIRPHTKAKSDKEEQYRNWAKSFHLYGMNLCLEGDAHMVKSTWPLRPSYDPGHHMGFIRDDVNGTTYVGEGCWGAPLRPNNDDKKWTRSSGSFNSFKWIFIDQERIEVRTIKTDNADYVRTVSPNNVFSPPKYLDIWNPSTGSVVVIPNRGRTKTIHSPIVKPKDTPKPPEPKVEIIPEFAPIAIDTDSYDARLTWKTKHEGASTKFYIKRSFDGLVYETIDSIRGLGSFSTAREYKYIDNNAILLNSKVLHYRIHMKTRGKEGSFIQLDEIKVVPWDNFFSIESNKGTGFFRLNFELDAPKDVQMQLYNTRGVRVLEQRFEKLGKGAHTRWIDAARLSPGEYLLALIHGDKFERWKVIIQ